MFNFYIIYFISAYNNLIKIKNKHDYNKEKSASLFIYKKISYCFISVAANQSSINQSIKLITILI